MIAQKTYECNICLEVAKDPVITTCGHLYCWKCIYLWLESNQAFLTCPVCKNGLKHQHIIPLYGKQQVKQEEQSSIPPRPKANRNRQVVNPAAMGSVILFNKNITSMINSLNLQRGILLAGYGLFPSMFNLLLVQLYDKQVNNKIQNDAHANQQVQYQIYLKSFWYLLVITLIMVLIFL